MNRSRAVAVTTLVCATATVLTTQALPAIGVGSTPAPILRIHGYGVGQAGMDESGSIEGGSPGDCHVLVYDGDGSVPAPFLVEPGRHTGQIRLHLRRRPTTARLQARGADNARVPVTSHLVRRKGLQGQLRWALNFHLTVAANENVFPELTLATRTSRACSTRQQFYVFHLRGARS